MISSSDIVMSDDLMAMKYADDDGKYHSVGIRILTQVIDVIFRINNNYYYYKFHSQLPITNNNCKDKIDLYT